MFGYPNIRVAHYCRIFEYEAIDRRFFEYNVPNNGSSYSSTRASLTRLVDKGLLRYTRDGVRYLFSPVEDMETAPPRPLLAFSDASAIVGLNPGAVHYHVIIWMPSGYHIPKLDKSKSWPYGMSEIKAAKNPVGYLAKYASKGDRYDSFPKGLRMHGSGGLSLAYKIEKRWWVTPSWVRNWQPEIVDIKRATGGGYFRVDTGEWRPSPWRVLFVDGKVFLRKME